MASVLSRTASRKKNAMQFAWAHSFHSLIAKAPKSPLGLDLYPSHLLLENRIPVQVLPNGVKYYALMEKRPTARNSWILRFQLPSEDARLGNRAVKSFLDEPALQVRDGGDYDANSNVDVENGQKAFSGEDEKKQVVTKTLEKSYSPISVPDANGYFDLLVKAYPYRQGGGMGSFLCQMKVGEKAAFKLKAPRKIHGVESLEDIARKWKRIGLVAGGTGLAPLMQIASVALGNADVEDVALLSFNKEEQDILMREEIDELVRKYGSSGVKKRDIFRVRHSLTALEQGPASAWEAAGNLYGRGTVEMAKEMLPAPSDDTLILVSGTDGFVNYWSGPTTRGPPLPNGKKGPKIQGPLLGVLKEAGYSESMVYKY